MATVNEALQAAFSLIEEGRTAEAGGLLARILDASPGQHTAHYLLGVISAQQGALEAAAGHFRAAIAGNGAAADYHFNLGKAEWGRGDSAAAIAAWRNARRLFDPRHPAAGQVMQWLGGALKEGGRRAYAENRLEEAADLLTEAVDCLPQDALAVLTLASVRQDQGRADDARAGYDRAIALDPALAAARVSRGLMARQDGDEAGARRWWRMALAMDPAYPAVWGLIAGDDPALCPAFWRRAITARLPVVHSGDWFGLALALSERGDGTAATDAYRNALAAEPAGAVAWNNLANLLSTDTPPAAAVAYGRALRLDPQYLPALVGLAGTEVAVGRPEAALAGFRAALALNPCSVAALVGLAESLRDLGDIDGALKAGQAALASGGAGDANNDEAVRFGLCLTRLTRGELALGWADYGLRRRTLTGVARWRDVPLPRWAGESAPGGDLLILPEQGIGDEVMFLGLLPDVLARGVAAVVECDPRLHPLLARTYPGPGLRLAARGRTPAPIPQGVAAHIAMGDLPAIFRREWADFASARPYLTADPAAVASARRRHGGGDPETFRIGVAWRSENRRYGGSRSLPPAALAQALTGPGVRLINLQYDNAEEAAAAMAAVGATLHCDHTVDNRNDIDGLAALIAACDLVVTIDNTTAHLAGALGAPTWVLLPAAADWRWFCDRPDSPWYPATRLFRQRTPGDWGAVLGEAAAALTAVLPTAAASGPA